MFRWAVSLVMDDFDPSAGGSDPHRFSDGKKRAARVASLPRVTTYLIAADTLDTVGLVQDALSDTPKGRRCSG